MKKTYLNGIKLAILCLSVLGITGIKVSANETYNIQSSVGESKGILIPEELYDEVSEIKWVSKPGDTSEIMQVGQEIKLPKQYVNQSGKRELNLVFYAKLGVQIDLNRYDVYGSSSVVAGYKNTPPEELRKGHLNIPIQNAEKFSICIAGKTNPDTAKIVATINITEFQPLTSASGLPLKYNTSYYIFNDKLKGKRGGLTFEQYSNVDRMIYSNSVTGKGTSMLLQNKYNTSSTSEIEWSDQVTVKSASANWGNSTYWSVNTNYPNVSYITLSSSPSTFYISKGRNVSNAIVPNNFGLSAVSASAIITGDIMFYLNSLNPIPDYNNKEWLKASGKYLFATNWMGEKDKLQNGLQNSQQDNMRAYEADYRADFKGLTTSSDKITYAISKKYHNAKIRYVLRINGNYLSESYDGTSYYSQSKENKDNIEITANVNLRQGDKVTLDVITNEPGYPINQSTVLQTLSSAVY